MGEIDTKPIESVQAAICLFGEKNDQRKSKSSSNDELEKEKELDDLMKDLANIKVQLEAKDSACKQALLKLDYYQKTADELSTLLKNSEFEKDIYENEFKEAKARVSELESTMKDMANQLSESGNIREQLLHVLSELRAREGELLRLEVELASAKDARFESMKQVELRETALSMEKLKTEELLRHVSELNETIMHLQMTAAETEKEIDAMIWTKEEAVQLAEVAATEAHEQLECVMKQLEVIHNLEKQLLDKSAFIDSLELELRTANELHRSSEKFDFDAICELNQVKEDLELKEGNNSDQAGYTNLLETELRELKMELHIANEKMNSLTRNAKEMKEELEKTRSEITEARKKETEAEIEIAMLNSELHKGRSRIAAATAAEERAKSEKSAAYSALQQLAVEVEEAKKENRQLKASGRKDEESERSSPVDIQQEDSPQSGDVTNIDPKTENEEGEIDEADSKVTLWKEEYEVLVKKAEQADQMLGHEDRPESENLKKELEVATSKIAEFRTRAEQAITRAEVAENAKAALEEQIKKWKAHRAKRKAAFTALREESISKEISNVGYDTAPKVYQPLGKVLNMKF